MTRVQCAVGVLWRCDQTTADTEGNQATESSSDGPAGYADTSPNANTQQEGEH